MTSDIAIAQAATLRPIVDLARERLGIAAQHLVPHGHDKAKLSLACIDSLRDRPAGMTADEAELAIQQVVYTLQAALQDRAPVGFFVDGERAEQVFGVPTSEPVTNRDQLDVLSLATITDPAEGASVSGTFTARGVASSFEATVPWEVRDGDTVVASGYSTAEGWMVKLYPWVTTVDLSDLAPGTYTFVAMTDDPSGGEGGGPFVDTRTITVG